MSTSGKTLRSRATDLVGSTFGRLLVTGRAENSSSGNARWICVCECGRTTVATGTDLRLDRTRTCGCGAAEATRRRHSKSRDLVGRRFGRLIVDSYLGLNSYPRAVWSCLCDCGARVQVTGNHLLDGATVSCGCRASDPRPGALRDDISYQSAHERVKRLHGPARQHTCVCGASATDWAYDWQDPDERVDQRGRHFSMKPQHYTALCVRCHRDFDKTTRAKRAS